MSMALKLQTYGCKEKKKSQFGYDRWAFSHYAQAKNPPPREDLFKKIIEEMVPGWVEFHSWSDMFFHAACTHRWIGVSGCSGAAKTRNAAGFAATWWLCAPHESSVILCSTTMKSLRKRGWAEIQNYAEALKKRNGDGYGNMVNSQTMWQNEKGDDRNAIFAIAVQEGDINKVAANIQGIHSRRQLVIIDEAEAVPAAIWKACANLYRYPIDAGGEFILIALANPRSRLSQFGRFIEPKGGWNTVTVEHEEWEGKPQLDGTTNTHVIRFDFRKSPNVLSSKIVSKHLPTKASVNGRLASLAARGAENDPDHWCFDLGFPPPDGLLKTPFSESMLVKAGAFNQQQFSGADFRIIGACDPAYTGDRPVVQFAALGRLNTGELGYEALEPIVLSLDATSQSPARYQLLDQIKFQCENVKYRGHTYQCRPEDFAIDTTGDAGLADIAQREWSLSVNRIMFSGSATDAPCSREDMRPAREVYANKRAEMYYQTRDAVETGQIKGLSKDTAAELCSLLEIVEKADGTVRPKKTLESKREYKKRYQKSPDLADGLVMVTEVAQLKGMVVGARALTAQLGSGIEELVQKANDIYADLSYSAENEEDPVPSVW